MFIIEKTCNRISNLLCSKICHRQVCCKDFCDYHYICRHRVAIGKYDQIKDCVKLDKWLSFVLKELASFCSVFIKSSRFFPVGFFAINLRPLWPFFFFFFFFLVFHQFSPITGRYFLHLQLYLQTFIVWHKLWKSQNYLVVTLWKY